MRPLFELIIIALVVFAGWNQPFKDHAAALFPNAGIQPSRTAVAAQRAARMEGYPAGSSQVPPRTQPLSKNPSWMWSETSMDRPYKSNGNVNR